MRKTTTPWRPTLLLGACLAVGCSNGIEPAAEPMGSMPVERSADGPASEEPLAASALPDGTMETFEERTPTRLQVRFTHTSDVEGAATATLIDASPSHPYFPMSQEVRAFGSKKEMVEFVWNAFEHLEPIMNEDGSLDGLRGTFVHRGKALFENRSLGIRYEVRDPILAYLAGAHGWVSLGEDRLCLDPDGECTDDYASYLEPEGSPTAPTHDPECNGAGNVCVEFHSFFNQSWFPIPFARHGSNVRFTRNVPIASTRLTTGGRFHFRTGLGVPEFDVASMPTASNAGRASVETAVACYFSDICPEYQAVAVCGTGTIRDPDLNVSRRTGNGPMNSTFCD